MRGAFDKMRDEQLSQLDKAFREATDRVRQILTQWALPDVLVALNASDLWPPNVSAQVKHQLAFAVCLSIPPDAFSSDRIESHGQLAEFLTALYEALPTFPTLEDYWPESDWGALRFHDGIDNRPCFYGGSVQRIPDFIEAFRILHQKVPQSQTDMRFALRLQAEYIEAIPTPPEAKPGEDETGHVELPAQWFWERVRDLMPSLDALGVTPMLIATPGNARGRRRAMGFGGAILSGQALPWLGTIVNGRFFPLSLRNGPSVVLDHWWSNPAGPMVDAAEHFTAFLSKRFRPSSLIEGRLHVASRRERAPQSIAAVLHGDKAIHAFVFCTIAELPEMHKRIAYMKRVMRESPNWAFLDKRGMGVQLRDAQGQPVTEASIEFTVVLAFASTQFLRVPLGKGELRVLPLVDAVSILDAVKDSNELSAFWRFVTETRSTGAGRMSDLTDLFGSFRDSHAQLIAGAVVPDFMMLDPHWGSSWRYKYLSEYWRGAPQSFPDDSRTWSTEESEAETSLRRVIARNARRWAWSAQLGESALHFVIDLDRNEIDPINGNVLETFLHCVGDSFAQRESLLSWMLGVAPKRIAFECVARSDSLASLPDTERSVAAEQGLLHGWTLEPSATKEELNIRLVVNLARVQRQLDCATDAAFEIECAVTVVSVLLQHLQQRAITQIEREALNASGLGKPRFVMKSYEPSVDVPQHVRAEAPRPEHYKVARRRLAEVLKEQGVEPGRYELEAAKALINPARLKYRDDVHGRLRRLDRDSLLKFCVEQIDAAITHYDQTVMRLRQSLTHEVDYDRFLRQADSHEEFVKLVRNYRYVIEAALFLCEPRADVAADEDVLAIVGMVDWLHVLYHASDTLHNGLDIGGLEVDSSFVPEVFFSEKGDEQDRAFAREMAARKLGVGVTGEDDLVSATEDKISLTAFDAALREDLGFSFEQMLTILATLVSWVTVGGAAEFACSYVASTDDIARTCVRTGDDLEEHTASLAIEFLTLHPDRIRRLAGKDYVEEDVPVWEHTKRTDRYMVKPLIRLHDGQILWGAAMANRAARIWVDSLSSGYLPADCPWPHVRGVAGKVKKTLEEGLEDLAHEVCARVAPYSTKGIDFMRRFRKHRFADVGDFDLLAYWPKENRWLIGECKYNQPPFCLKDARRLREAVFGDGASRGQFEKIERRRAFLTENLETLRDLLKWPSPQAGVSPDIVEIYLCKDLHWCFYFPPYAVPTQFSQIDGFAAWLSKNDFASTDAAD